VPLSAGPKVILHVAREDVFAAALQSLGETIAAALTEAIASTADALLADGGGRRTADDLPGEATA
jgi:hypothetical protein